MDTQERLTWLARWVSKLDYCKMKAIMSFSCGMANATRHWRSILAMTIAFSFSPPWLNAGTAQSAPVARVDGDNLSVEAEGVQLDRLLREVGDLVSFDTLILSPEAKRTPVTVSFRDVPIKDGILKIMEAAGINHVVWGGEGVPFRIFAGSAEDPVPSQTSPAENEALYPDEEDEFSSPAPRPPSTGRVPSTRRRAGPGAIVPPPTQPRSQSPSATERSVPEAYPEELPPDDPGQIPLDEFPPDEPPPEDIYEPDWPSSPSNPSTPPLRQRQRRATDEAFLLQRPDTMAIAKVWGFLIFGFALGIPLVRERSQREVPRRIKKRNAETTRS